MAPPDVWPESAGNHEQPHEESSANQGHAQPAGMRDDAGREGPRRGRILYPVAVIAGILFLIILAAL